MSKFLYNIKGVISSLGCRLYNMSNNKTLKRLALNHLNPLMSQAYKANLLAKLEG